MRNLLWQSDAWKEYESLQAEKLILKKVNKLLKTSCGMVTSVPMEKWKCERVISVDLPALVLIRRTGSFSV